MTTDHTTLPDTDATDVQNKPPSKLVIGGAAVFLVISVLGAGTYGWPYILAAVLSVGVLVYELRGPFNRYLDAAAQARDGDGERGADR